jgi:hypothetical protein
MLSITRALHILPLAAAAALFHFHLNKVRRWLPLEFIESKIRDHCLVF